MKSKKPLTKRELKRLDFWKSKVNAGNSTGVNKKELKIEKIQNENQFYERKSAWIIDTKNIEEKAINSTNSNKLDNVNSDKKTDKIIKDTESNSSHNNLALNKPLKPLANNDDKIKIQSKKAKKKGYVVFVGNLNFTTNVKKIKDHFSITGGVKDVRLLTSKETGQSRGCAYVEFKNSNAHKIGLSLNESTLDDRPINVEFTSPGRNTPLRMRRLKEKNKKAEQFRKSKNYICT